MTLQQKPAQNLVKPLKDALVSDEWFQQHKDNLSMKEGLAWKGTKIYVLDSEQTWILQRSHNTRAAGYFGFTPSEETILVAINEKDIEAFVASCPVCVPQ